MAKLTGKQIQELAKSIIAAYPGGIRYKALVAAIAQQNPETPENTIHGNVWDLDKTFPNEVAKPSRGLFTPATKAGNDTVSVGSTEQVAPTGVKVKESDFYELFAEWLKNDLDEVTEVASLGGAGLIDPFFPAPVRSRFTHHFATDTDAARASQGLRSECH